MLIRVLVLTILWCTLAFSAIYASENDRLPDAGGFDTRVTSTASDYFEGVAESSEKFQSGSTEFSEPSSDYLPAKHAAAHASNVAKAQAAKKGKKPKPAPKPWKGLFYDNDFSYMADP